MNRANGRHPALKEEQRGDWRASGAQAPSAVPRDASSFAFLTTTVDETVLEGRYRSALAAWKDAVKSADTNDTLDRQRLQLLQRAYLESLSALEEARTAASRGARFVDERHGHGAIAARNAEMILRQHDARALASEQARRRRGLFARIFKRG